MKPKLLLVCLILSTIAKSQSINGIQPQVIRIDPSNSFGAKTSELFEEIKFIPLETTKESLFSRIENLQVTEKYFIIYDHNGNKVVVFTKDGKFYGKIDLKAANASILDGFSVNRFNSEIIVRGIHKGNSLLVFDYKGDFLRKEKGDIIGPYFIMLDSGFIAHQNSYREPTKRQSNTNYDLFISKGFNTVIRKELQFHLMPKGIDGVALLNRAFTYSPQINQYVYSKLEDYSFHFFTHLGIKKTYRLILPAEVSLPGDFLMDSSLIGKRHKYISENPNVIYKPNNIFFIDDYLLFHLEKMGPRDRDRIIAYNVNNGNAFSFGKITPDSSCFYLPIVNRNSDVLATDDRYIYISVGAPALVKMKNTRGGEQIFTNEMNEFFKKDSRMNNPVLIQLKLKKGR